MTYRVYVGKRSVVVTEVRQIVFVSLDHIFLPNLIFLSLGQWRFFSLTPLNLFRHVVFYSVHVNCFDSLTFVFA